MRKNYKLLLKSKEIFKYFKFVYKNRIDIFDSHTMEYNLRTTWAELTFEDLKLMEETIEKDINDSNLNNSLLGSGISILIALWIGYVAIINTASFTSISTVMIIFVLFITMVYINHFRLNRRNIRIQTIVRVLLDIKKSEQNT
ncbi:MULTISPECIES: hypothetical protein [Lysinibacillus]|uniref:Uncharacterized protein n=1 Tax=Lysinibacillus capsici TaxID=2115968 RepID=A0ABY8KK72_9BACI|nr:hypothetical protein [Lysinibacillus capsici]WGF39898.1 hypothetical protein QBO96_06430 [Lysinibacillus capsici]